MSACTHEIPRAQLLREREIRLLTNTERLERSTLVRLPYSEVCLHMNVAGIWRPVLPCANAMAWILNVDGSTFSFPVTRGEAGLPYEPMEART